MEWVIVDDSDEGQTVSDLVADLPNVRYTRLPERIKLGRKRNMLNDMAKGAICVNMDDDDYSHPKRVATIVRLLLNSKVDIVGSSILFLYFLKDAVITQCGPYSAFHATAGTWGFRKTLLGQGCKFDDDAEKAEEKVFLKGFSVPMVQMDAMSSILVMCHPKNTVSKDELRTRPERCLMKDRVITLKQWIGKDKWAIDFIRGKTC
jgi:glycosyltransferase involved in cell wall biosynthesis